jgi:hypothetical protein
MKVEPSSWYYFFFKKRKRELLLLSLFLLVSRTHEDIERWLSENQGAGIHLDTTMILERLA